MLAPDGSSVSVDEFELTLFFEGFKVLAFNIEVLFWV